MTAITMIEPETPTQDAIEQLQREIALEAAELTMDSLAQPILSSCQRPIYDVQVLAPQPFCDPDMLRSQRERLDRAVRYLDLLGRLERPISGRPELVCFKRGSVA